MGHGYSTAIELYGEFQSTYPMRGGTAKVHKTARETSAQVTKYIAIPPAVSPSLRFFQQSLCISFRQLLQHILYFGLAITGLLPKQANAQEALIGRFAALRPA